MIYIKTEANDKVGGGHLGRSYSLAVEFVKRGFDVKVILTNTPVDIGNFDNHIGISFQFFEDKLKYDLKSYLSIISPGSIIIFDTDDKNYYSGKLIAGLREVNIITACFTISNAHFYETDFLINPNIVAFTHNYHTASYTKLLLGPKYMIFSEKYRGDKINPKDNKGLTSNLMLTFGNADLCNLNQLFLEVLSTQRFSFQKIFIIVGKFVPNYSNLNELSKKCKENKVEIIFNSTDLRKYYTNVDGLITTGGMSMWEGVSYALPVFVFASSKRELGYVDYMSEQKYIYKFGDFRTQPDGDYIASLLNEIPKIIKNKYELNINELRKKIDTNGIQNIIDTLLQ